MLLTQSLQRLVSLRQNSEVFQRVGWVDPGGGRGKPTGSRWDGNGGGKITGAIFSTEAATSLPPIRPTVGPRCSPSISAVCGCRFAGPGARHPLTIEVAVILPDHLRASCGGDLAEDVRAFGER